MFRNYGRSAAVLLATTALYACSSVSTVILNPNKDHVSDGVIYYLPKRPIQVTITIPVPKAPQAGGGANANHALGGAGRSADAAAGGNASSNQSSTAQGAPIITVDTIDSVPDMTRRFVLRYSWPRNILGENHATIKVTPSGLLTSVGSNTISGIVSVVQSIAKSLGSVTAMTQGLTALVKEQPCTPGVPYSRLIFPEDVAAGKTIPPLCNYTIKLATIDGGSLVPPPAKIENGSRPDAGGKSGVEKQNPPSVDTARLTSPGADQEGQSGVFYRQDIPYQVQITDPDGRQTSQFIAYSPDLSPIGFAPVPRSFFANANTSLTFTNGVLTGVDSDVNGELAGALELPADFISAYTTALGGIFSQIGTAEQNRTTAIENETHRQVCAAAIQANKPAIQPAAITGKQGSDFTTAWTAFTAAWANIKAACGS